MSGPLRLGGVPEHFNLPWHLAMESGALGRIEATWEDQYGGTGQMLSSLEAGDLDIVSILTEGTVAAIAGGLPVTIVQVYVQTPLQWGIHVPANSDLHDVDQLEGGRIAISRFRSGSHLMAFVQADRLGWSLDADQFVVVGGLDGARTSLGAGEADQFLWDRFMTEPFVEAGEFRLSRADPALLSSSCSGAPNSGTATGSTTSSGATLDANHLRVLEDGLVLSSEATLYKTRADVWDDAATSTHDRLMAALGLE